MKLKMENIGHKSKCVVIIGVLVAIVLSSLAFLAFRKSEGKDLFDIFSFVAALISIELGIVALAYAWYVNRESTFQLKEIIKANEDSKRIAMDWNDLLVKTYQRQTEILEFISNKSLQQLTRVSSDYENVELGKEYQRHKDMLEQLNKESNDLHQLFIKSLH